jgi:hypothetical protein
VPASDLADQLESAAIIHIAGGQTLAAVDQLQWAWVWRELVHGPNSLDIAADAYWIALEATRLNRLQVAGKYARQAYETQIRCCGDFTQDVGQDAVLLARILSRRSHQRDAEVEWLLKKAISIRTAHHSVDLAQAQLFLALFLAERHRATEARALLSAVPEQSVPSEGDFAVNWTADIQRWEESQYWIRETNRYCAVRGDSDSSQLCRRLPHQDRGPLSASRATPALRTARAGL